MKTIFVTFATLLALVTTSPLAAAQTIRLRWDSPSKLTPARAVEVLAAHAVGEPVSPTDLFESEKHLRTDRPLSLGGSVAADVVEELLAARIAEAYPEIRIIDVIPVLQWLVTEPGPSDVVRIRGESVMLAVLNADPNLAATLVDHDTRHREWRLCGTTPCLAPVDTPVRTNVEYRLTIPLDGAAPAEAQVSELVLATGFEGSVFAQTQPIDDPSGRIGVACDPLPSTLGFPAEPTPGMTFSHAASETRNARTNRMLCAFFAIDVDLDTRFEYRAAGALAAPPSTGSATVRNPASFTLYAD